jgi:adenylate kinase family enzyme
VVEHYRATGRLVGIRADRPVDDVFADVRAALERAGVA